MPTKTLADEGRYVSRLTRDTVAMILAGGRGSRLYELTDWRAKPGVYFGGKLRIIDFPLVQLYQLGCSTHRCGDPVQGALADSAPGAWLDRFPFIGPGVRRNFAGFTTDGR